MTKKYKFLHFFHQHFWDTLKEILIYLMWKENKNNGVGQALNCCPKNDWSWNRRIFFLYVLSYFFVKSFLPLFFSVSFLIFLSVCFLLFMKRFVRLFFSVSYHVFWCFQCFFPRLYKNFLLFQNFLSCFFLRVSFLVCFVFLRESFLPIFFRKTSLPLFVLCFVPCFLWVSFITFYKKILSFFWSASFRFFSKISFSWLQLDSNPRPLVHKQKLNHFSKLLAVTSCLEQGVPWHSGT